MDLTSIDVPEWLGDAAGVAGVSQSVQSLWAWTCSWSRPVVMRAIEIGKNSLEICQVILKIYQCINVKTCSRETGTPIIEFYVTVTWHHTGHFLFNFTFPSLEPRLRHIPDERSEVVLDVIIRCGGIESVIFTSSRHPHNCLIALKTVTNFLCPRIVQIVSAVDVV